MANQSRPVRPTHTESGRPPLLQTSDIMDRHIGSVLAAFVFLGLFIFTVPVAHILPLQPTTELTVICLLFAACHLMNWPMLTLRWRLWFRGELSNRAALLTSFLLMGTFGIPFYILFTILMTTTA